ncbi:MAG: hypothetical protein CL678_14025 [Bdellovibrionaceae bacterium]|nr:hypothetical protein [Pseudobdellovibrionaceae bacterium]|tara:strand:- start:2638 stop:3690 length:1053 start_codon:yes stop_codon:yes gene_type:complete
MKIFFISLILSISLHKSYAHGPACESVFEMSFPELVNETERREILLRMEKMTDRYKNTAHPKSSIRFDLWASMISHFIKDGRLDQAFKTSLGPAFAPFQRQLLIEFKKVFHQLQTLENSQEVPRSKKRDLKMGLFTIEGIIEKLKPTLELDLEDENTIPRLSYGKTHVILSLVSLSLAWINSVHQEHGYPSFQSWNVDRVYLKLAGIFPMILLPEFHLFSEREKIETARIPVHLTSLFLGKNSYTELRGAFRKAEQKRKWFEFSQYLPLPVIQTGIHSVVETKTTPHRIQAFLKRIFTPNETAPPIPTQIESIEGYSVKNPLSKIKHDLLQIKTIHHKKEPVETWTPFRE